MKSVFIAGGTGFLGYHAALEFLKKGIEVDTIALPNEIDLRDWYPKEIGLSYGNLFDMDEQAIAEIFRKKKYDAFVYALGPDERVTPDAPAFDFFYDRLVRQGLRIIRIAKNTGIKRFVILNSYFAYFDRLQNGKLAKHHPYIAARVAQGKELIAFGTDTNVEVMVLELPYIFGSMPNREPLWKKHFLASFDNLNDIYFPDGGGTAIIDVIGVGQAIVAAAINGKHGKQYPIGNGNMTFRTMITIMMESIKSKKKFVGVPVLFASIAGKNIMKKNRKAGKEGGLHYAKLMTQIQNKLFYIDHDRMKTDLGFKELGYDGGRDIKESIRITMKACYPESFKDDN